MTKIVLPTAKIKASIKSPRKLVIFSKPKTGKTTVFAELKDSLILDLENGTDFLDAVKVKINTMEDLGKVGSSIIAAGKPYKYIIVDTVTKLEDIAIKLAAKMYRATPIGKNWGKTDSGEDDESANVLTLPNGAGYLYQRLAMEKLLQYIETLADRIIYSGHIKTRFLETKGGKEVVASELDLTGKVKSMLSADMDAIGLLYRNGNQNILTFATKDEVICGARPSHLKNKEIVLSEYDEKTGEVKTYWDKVYVD